MTFRRPGELQKSPFAYAAFFLLFLPLFVLIFISSSYSETLRLDDLIDEALKNNHEVLLIESRAATAGYRIPQAESLPDPMFMIGYQNEGFERYTYGDMPDAQWMFSVSQMFPFPGKRSLRKEMASRDTENLSAQNHSVRFRTVARVKELYYDLFLQYRDIDLIKEKAVLFTRIEEAALSRYSAGLAPQQEVLMAQTEKYMLLEREEMLHQKTQTTETMLNAILGRPVNAPLARPSELKRTEFYYTLEDLFSIALEQSPEIRSRHKMISAADAKLRMMEREFYPDFTVTGSVITRGGEFDDMWSLTTSFNIPLYYWKKQKQAVLEAQSTMNEATHELEAAKLMVFAGIRENHAMFRTAERLMELYLSGLIPKTYQDFESSLSGYRAGKTELTTVISRIRAFLDAELLYWSQFVEREKALARIESFAGIPYNGKESARSGQVGGQDLLQVAAEGQ